MAGIPLRLCVLLVFTVVFGEAMAQSRLPVKQSSSASFPEPAKVRVIAADADALRRWLANNLPHAQMRASSVSHAYVISGLRHTEDITRLMNSSLICHVERADRLPLIESAVPGHDLSVNGITAVHHRHPQIAGYGLGVSVRENAFDKDDLDLKGRVLYDEAMPGLSDQHATAMATIIAGAGNSSPYSKGVAWNAKVAHADFGDLMPDPAETLLNAGIYVQNHAYGVGVENFYGIEAHAYDDQCFNYPSIVHVFSSGNAGDETVNAGPYRDIAGHANLTGQFKTSKNTLCVGAVDRAALPDARSSRGPTSDGRVKPEVVAYGHGGSSEAAALVSGVCLLAQQAYLDVHGVLPPSSLIRAALVNTASDAGAPHVDHQTGFGNVDADGLIRTMMKGTFFSGSVAGNDSQTFDVEVPEGTNRLKVTLAWTDVPAAPGAEKVLVNDLDMTVTAPGGVMTYQPWILSTYPHPDSLARVARRGEDHRNNIEQITIDKPSGGLYTIAVRGYDVSSGPQEFSVAYELQDGIRWIYPTPSDPVESGSEVALRWRWFGDDQTAVIRWRIIGDDEWTDIAAVALSRESIPWRVPGLNELLELSVWVEDAFIWMDTVTVSQPPDLVLGYRCGAEALYVWDDVSVNGYNLYQLKGNFFEPIGMSSDTVLLLDTDESPGEYIGVAANVRGRPGVRSRSVSYHTGFADCYVRSFLAREPVSDSIVLNLTLGTQIGLHTLFLERESPHGFQIIQTHTPVREVSYQFYDADPVPGRNRYRVRLERSNGQTVLSDIEEVWFTRDHDVAYFPNPVVEGSMVNLIVESDPVMVSVYNTEGKLIRHELHDGEVKILDTRGWGTGLFMIRITTRSGTEMSARLMVR